MITVFVPPDVSPSKAIASRDGVSICAQNTGVSSAVPVVTDGTDNLFGSWVQVLSSFSEDTHLATISITPDNQYGYRVLEIAIGEPSAETPIARIEFYNPGTYVFPIVFQLPFLRLITAGTRLSARAAGTNVSSLGRTLQVVPHFAKGLS